MPIESWKQPKTKRRQQERAAQLQAETLSQIPPVEISSGAILPCGYWLDGSIFYSIQANTLQGLRTFQEVRECFHLSGGGVSGELTFPRHAAVYWAGWTADYASGAVSVPLASFNSEPGSADEFSPADVIAILTGEEVSAAKHRQVILAAEILRFDEQAAEALKPVLRAFIDSHFRTDEKEEFVAVASAIRQYIAFLSVAELPAVGDLLRVERKAPPPIESEIAKMLTRKLTAALPEETGGFEALATELADLANSYLNPRTLSKRYFGVTVLDAILSLALLRSHHLPELMELVRSLRINWFRTIVIRQAQELRSALASRFTPERCREACQALTELAAAAEALPP